MGPADQPTGTIREFVCSVPLYQDYLVKDSTIDSVFTNSHASIDAFCPKCKSDSIFARVGTIYHDPPDDALCEWKFACRRDRFHVNIIVFRRNGQKLNKFGQLPSLADIAIGELGPLRKTLLDADARELTRAIGLAAHGVGIGSFVYLRRVFEHLIQKRYQQYASEIDADAFAQSRMVEKIGLLSNHLPAFMVDNRSIYGILSRGVHTLSDEVCREAFPMMRDSIMMILEEDARKAEDLRKREELGKSINSLNSFLAVSPPDITLDEQ